MLQLRLLGQFEARLDDQPVLIPSRPAQSLLAYLALNAGTPFRREKLAGLFWPDATEANARSNLRHELWRLRKILEGGLPPGRAYFLADDISIALNAAAKYWIDAAILEKSQRGYGSVEDWMNALALYRGELLPGFYDEWVVLERERVHSVFEQSMQRLLDRLVQARR
jgi:DNA-binding SARP family transcriptional activator